MGIKICKEKFENRMDNLTENFNKFSDGFNLALEIILPVGLIVSIIFIIFFGFFNSIFGILPLFGIVLGGFGTFMIYAIRINDSDELVIEKINAKLHLFEWNEDC